MRIIQQDIMGRLEHMQIGDLTVQLLLQISDSRSGHQDVADAIKREDKYLLHNPTTLNFIALKWLSKEKAVSIRNLSINAKLVQSV